MVAALKPADLKRLQADPAEFRMALRVDTGDSTPKLLGRILDPWQAKDFGALDAGWQKVAGQPITAEGPVYLRSYWERPRGHDKTGGTATMAAYALFASRRRIKGVAAAGTKDQARFLLDDIERKVQLNPWLRDFLEVQANRVINKHTKSELAVIAAEAPTSYGLLIDFCCLDEQTHWPEAGEALWHSLFTAVGKRPTCMLSCIANAGLGEGACWQWDVREMFRTSPNFYFSRLEGPVASWISQATLDEQRRILPPIIYERYWGNLWTSGNSDAWPLELIDGAMTLKGPHLTRQNSATYILGVDLALSHDAAAAVAIAKTGTHIELANVFEWRPPSGGEISIDAIEETILRAHACYRFQKVACDPWNAAQLIQRLSKRGIPIEARPQSGVKLLEQCATTIELFRSHAISLYDSPSLTKDLKHARIEERPYGYRFVATRSADGHMDRLTALSIAAAIAKDVVAPPSGPWAIVTPGHVRTGQPFGIPGARPFNTQHRWPSIGGRIL